MTIRVPLLLFLLAVSVNSLAQTAVPDPQKVIADVHQELDRGQYDDAIAKLHGFGPFFRKLNVVEGETPHKITKPIGKIMLRAARQPAVKPLPRSERVKKP